MEGKLLPLTLLEGCQQKDLASGVRKAQRAAFWAKATGTSCSVSSRGWKGSLTAVPSRQLDDASGWVATQTLIPAL